MGAFIRRQWLRLTNWPRWRWEECNIRGVHDGVTTGDGGFYTTQCRYCSWSHDFEAWGE